MIDDKNDALSGASRLTAGLGCKVVKGRGKSEKTLPTLLHKVWMNVAGNNDMRSYCSRMLAYAAIVVPCALNASAVTLAEQGKGGGDGGAVLLDAIAQREHGGLVVLDDKNLVGKSGAVGNGDLAQTISMSAPKLQAVSGKDGKQSSSNADECDVGCQDGWLAVFISQGFMWYSIFLSWPQEKQPNDQVHRPAASGSGGTTS